MSQQTASVPTPAAKASALERSVILGLTAVFVTYFISAFVMQTQGIAAPRMAADLNGMPLYSWGIAIPALASAIATLIMGKFSDMFGRRLILAICMVLFFIGSLMAALSQTFTFLIAARFVQALGMGALAPLSFTVIGDLFNPVERAKWSGLLNIPAGICALIGPVLGGVITDQLSWRWLFWIALPMAVIAFVLVMIGIPALTQKAKHKIDFLGGLMMIVASATMIVGFSWGGVTYPWASVQVLGLLAFSVLVWALFIWYEGKVEEPLLDPQVLTNRTFITAAGAGFMSFFGLLGIMMYYPLFLQGV
jgi:MFS family permease